MPPRGGLAIYQQYLIRNREPGACFKAFLKHAPVAWLILTGVVLWAVAYDTMYAMVDREDDIYVGVKSTAILFGEMDRLMIGVVQLCFFVVMLLVGNQLELGRYYYLGLTCSASSSCARRAAS